MRNQGVEGPTSINSRPRSLWLFDLALFLALAGALAWKALTDLDGTWDSIAYHLPFAALRTGIFGADEYGLTSFLASCFAGFPAAPDYLKGLLWRTFGTANAANLVSVLALVLFCTFLNRAFRIPLTIGGLGVAAIPVIHVNLAGNYTDLVSNLAFTAALLLTTRIFLDEKPRPWSLVGARLCCGTAANFKLQFVVFASALAFGLLGLVIVRRWATDLHQELGPWTGPFLALTLVGVGACFAVPARNALLFGNPLYPVKLTILGYALPGTVGPEAYTQPVYLRGAPQPVRWLLSVLEYHAFDFRPVPYTVGQGDVPATAPSSRMGGYLAWLVLMNLGVFAWRIASGRSAKRYVVAVGFAAGTLLVAMLPSSHELRYFSFWVLYLLTINMVFLWNDAAVSIAERRLFSMMIISAFLFVVSITGGVYVKSYHRTIPKLISDLGIRERFVSKFEAGGSYCLINWGAFPMLAAPQFHRELGIAYRVKHASSRGDCAPGQTVVDYSATK